MNLIACDKCLSSNDKYTWAGEALANQLDIEASLDISHYTTLRDFEVNTENWKEKNLQCYQE